MKHRNEHASRRLGVLFRGLRRIAGEVDLASWPGESGFFHKLGAALAFVLGILQCGQALRVKISFDASLASAKASSDLAERCVDAVLRESDPAQNREESGQECRLSGPAPVSAGVDHGMGTLDGFGAPRSAPPLSPP